MIEKDQVMQAYMFQIEPKPHFTQVFIEIEDIMEINRRGGLRFMDRPVVIYNTEVATGDPFTFNDLLVEYITDGRVNQN